MSGRCVWPISLLLLWLGCGGASEPGGFRAELVPVDTIHLQEPDTLFLGEFISVTATLDPFRLYVPDFRLSRVVVYDSLGRPLQVIGRPGFDEPGTLLRPYYVLVLGPRLYVQEAYNRISLFTTAGEFLGRRRLPAGYDPYYPFHALSDQRLLVVSVAYQEPCSLPTEPACRETRVVSEVDTSLSRVWRRWGTFPELYQKHALAPRQATLDVLSQASLVAMGYTLDPSLYLYAVTDSGGVFKRRIVLEHPAWRNPTEEMTVDLALNHRARWEALMLQSSQVRGVYFVADTLVLVHFDNLAPGYFRAPQQRDYTRVLPYGVLVSISGTWQQALELPGPVLGRDEAFHLYIRLSDEPDRRLIGRFRVEVRQ
ncbi:hypothetical protein ABUL39_14420 [Rhodothermus marinus]|uniref:hypothetical protein n=1 Tax=Rhodothermus marinus TaxID=29549 RepID=UPI0037C932AA